MYWLILFASSILEAVWAVSLSESEGFTKPVPTIVFSVAVTLSMIGLAFAMKGIPTSVAYAVWTGTGAALTVTFSLLTGAEEPSVLKVLFLAGIIGCVLGLKFAPAGEPKSQDPAIPSSTATQNGADS